MGIDSLDSLHPLVREWFVARYGSPTPVQAESWPRLARGEHILAIAPTGSGKTLAAFLVALSRLFTGELDAGCCSVLYVSPLKALGEDMRRNLEEPLEGIAELFRQRAVAHSAVRVALRSGDTTQAERRRIALHPPSILVTTPESLCLMLDAPSGRGVLRALRLVIVDEIHAIAGNKRGSLLACALGRLALLSGEFQRIALSATLRPPEAAAAFAGGRQLLRDAAGGVSYRVRPVAVVAPPAEKAMELRVEWPVAAEEGELRAPAGALAAPRYEAIVPAILERLGSTKALLVFTDSRRRAERIAFLVNEARGEGSAWAHHGSLSREARRVVEERFKAGELGCVVATASLELGIDIGSVGEVVLAGTPSTVASALQRIGRAGHGVGEVSRARLLPFHGMDLLLAAAAVKGVLERAVEETRPLSCPLDVLAQVLLELVLEPELDLAPFRTPDELYDIVLSFPPFERLSRGLFDSTLQMLSGRYSGGRLRELEPRINLDAVSGTARAAKGARTLLYSSGGAIPDRGLYSMRVALSKARIGELDEEFVFERRVGEVFAMGAQTWRILDIGDEAVLVEPAPPDPDIIPFWKGEPFYRGTELSSRVLRLLDRLRGAGDESGAAALLEREYCFSSAAAEACVRFVGAQAAAGLGRPSLPGLGRVVLEINDGPEALRRSVRLVLHTLRGRAINEPLGLALAAAMEEELGLPVQRIVDDDLVLIVAPRAEGADPAALLVRALADLSSAGRLEGLVRSRLESSGVFGAQFRENAGRALLLPRGAPGRRSPLWMTRLRAKRLFAATRERADFPVIVETWRSCLSDLFDLEGARRLAEDIAGGRIELSSFESRAPSPFAREALWREVGENMYRTDELVVGASSSVSGRIVEEALRSSRLRPRIDPATVADFEARLKRLVPGWAPEEPFAFAEWVKERVLVPASELASILAAAGPALAAELAADPSCGGRVLRVTLPGATEEVLVHAERMETLSADPASQVGEWLRREAAVPPDRIAALFGLDGDELDAAIGALVEEGLVVDDFAFGEADEGATIIDAQNLEILLRRSRAAARPSVVSRPSGDLARLVFAVQGIGGAPTAGAADRSFALESALSVLEGYPLPAALWESEILPARVGRFRSADLDAFLSASPWQWFGCGKGLVALAEAANLDLFLAPHRARSVLVPPDGGRHDFWTLRERSGLGAAETVRRLWAEAWKGLVASDSFQDLREGIASSFGENLPEPEGSAVTEAAGLGRRAAFGAPRRVPRALRERWKGGAPLAGRWFALDFDEADPLGDEEPDALGRIGLESARVRILASRYGLICRSLLEREAPGMRWGELFPAMRRLELAGELLSARFFEGIEGPQFMDPAAFPVFLALDDSPGPAPSWLNALDPAASSLYAASERQGLLPTRSASSRICVGAEGVLAASTRSYHELALAVDPDDSRLPVILRVFGDARSRDAGAERRIFLEAVNGVPAASSPFVGALRDAGFETDRGRMALW